MSLSLKPLRPSVQWLDEPELAFAGGLTHIDPKVGIPASGPWSRDQPNHPASVTAGFIGTAECIAKARAWLSRAAEGVDGDDDHHPFCGFQLSRAVRLPAPRRTGRRRRSRPARSAT